MRRDGRAHHVDVIVVGAGMAGLAAARALRRSGVRWVVLEARERAGGRVHTLGDPRVTSPIELGAEFVHGDAPHLEAIAGEAGAAILHVGGEHRAPRRGRLARVDYWGPIDRVLRRIDAEGDELSAAEFLARGPGGRALARARGLTRGYLEGFHAARLERLGTRSLVAEDGESPTASAARLGRVEPGMGALVEHLAEPLAGAIHLGREVRAIRWRPGHVEVEALARGRSSRWSARAVVLTAPIAVLAARPSSRGGMSLDPDPPRLRRALARLATGSAVRLVLAFREAPWQRDPDEHDAERMSFLHPPGAPYPVWWSAYPRRAGLVVAWCGGPRAEALSGASSRRVIALAESQLARALRRPPRRVRAARIGAWWHDWSRDPWARGAYSYPRVGGSEAWRALSRPEEGTLFLAGEATHEESGTVEAALASGERAARQVIAALGRARGRRARRAVSASR